MKKFIGLLMLMMLALILAGCRVGVYGYYPSYRGHSPRYEYYRGYGGHYYYGWHSHQGGRHHHRGR